MLTRTGTRPTPGTPSPTMGRGDKTTMNNETFVGNLTRDPELRHSSEGKPRATFSLAINEGEGDNEKTHFLDFTAFGTLGENVAASLVRGQRLVVSGRVSTYKKDVTINGEDKSLTMVGFVASAVGPDLRWATAKVSKVERSRVEPADAGAEEAPSQAEAAPAKAAAPAAKPAATKAAKPAANDDF